MKEYRFVGVHADELEGGRPLAPGEYTGAIDASNKSPKNHLMVEEGLLIEVENGTAEKVAAIDAATLRKGDHLTDEEWNDPSKVKDPNEKKKGAD